MAITALQLITNSMRLLGAVASGESPTTDEQNDALVVLNDLLDSCNNKGLVVFANSNSAFSLIGGQQSYTIGPDRKSTSLTPSALQRPTSPPPVRSGLSMRSSPTTR